jgi:hypothetical protein
MEKDLIVVSATCNTLEKEDWLRSLVRSFDDHRNFFDIMVISHTPIPIDIADKCDWAIFDKKNERLERNDCLSHAWVSTGTGITIHSIYTSSGKPTSYQIPIWRTMAMGNLLAVNLGYKKVHHFEYDTKILSLDELIENSATLEEMDVILYISKAGDALGCYQAYRVNSILDMIKGIHENEWIEFIANQTMKAPEWLLEKILSTNTKVEKKSSNVLAERGIYTNLSMDVNVNPDIHFDWCTPYYQKEDNSIHFFVRNDSKKKKEIKLIYNNTLITRDIDPGFWYVIPLDSNYDNAKELIVIVNERIRNIFNFDEIREAFKVSSYITSQ